MLYRKEFVMRRSFPIPPAAFGICALVALVLAAAPALAAGGNAPIAQFLPPDQAPMFSALAQAPQPQAHKGNIGDPSAQGFCVADCWDGTSRDCSGSTCNAVDSSCSTGQSGYCYGSDTGYKYCPTCPSSTCSAQATCSDGSTVFCKGTTGDCFGVNNCYAYCDGLYDWCPNPPLCPV